MRKFLPVGVTALLFLCTTVSQSEAQEKEPLRLVQTIPMPNVKGRIDHMDVDVKGKRLFVAGLENGSLEVVDLAAGKWSKSIPGFKKTQGVVYIPSLNKVFVASGDEVAAFPTVEGMDGVYFNAARKRVYLSGGRDNDVGYVFVYQQKDADHYDLIGKIPTKPGAGTSFWSPELNRFYVAAPARDGEEAAILIFEPQP